MDITSVLGVVLGIVAILVGMVLKGVSVTALINPAAILIIMVGTIAAVITAFPLSELKRLPKIFKILFFEQKLTKPEDLIKTFSEWAVIARKEGLLAHGKFKPVASNETKKGRAKNRRVEILIVPRTAINE